MHVNIRMVAAMLGGLLCVVGAIVLSGGHAQDLISAPSLIVVAGIAIGALVALRGMRTAGRVLRAAFIRHEGGDAARDELVDGIEVLERTSFVAGFVGVMGGSIGAMNEFHLPMMIGPSIHFVFVSLLYCLFINVFFALPLKQQLLREVEPSMQLSRRQAVVRAVRGCVVVLVAVVAFSVWYGPGGELSSCASVPGLLFMLAGLLPSALVASDSVFSSPVSESRQLWYSNALLSSGLVAVCCGLMHVFSVLDYPALVWPGLAWAVASSVPPFAGAVLLRLRTSPASLRVSGADRHGLPNLYFGFAAFAVAALTGLTLLVVLALNVLDVAALDTAAAAAPR